MSTRLWRFSKTRDWSSKAILSTRSGYGALKMSDYDHGGHIEPGNEAGAAFRARNLTGEIVMLNMLEFRDVADYSATPELAPDSPISGEEAYRRYSIHTLPLLQAAGGSVVYSGTGGPYLIGPMEKTWDLVLLVRHRSVQAFMAFATDKEYLAGAGHRTAALRDSRLLPLADLPMTAS